MTDEIRDLLDSIEWRLSCVHDRAEGPSVKALSMALDEIRKVRALASPAPSTSTADQECDHRMCSCHDGCECRRETCDHDLAPLAVEGMIRDEALEEAAKAVESMIQPESSGEHHTVRTMRAVFREAATRIRSLKGQPPPAAPADQSKETPHE